MRRYRYGSKTSWLEKNLTFPTILKAWEDSWVVDHLYIYEDQELIAVLNIKESLVAYGYEGADASVPWRDIVIEESKKLLKELRHENISTGG